MNNHTGITYIAIVLLFFVSHQLFGQDNTASIEITQQPSYEPVCAGEAISLSVAANGASLTYQWQMAASHGYQNIIDSLGYSGSQTTNLSIGAIKSTMNAYLYRCQISDGTTVVFSKEVYIRLKNAVLSNSPTDGIGYEGDYHSFEVRATGSALAFQWQVDRGEGFVNITEEETYTGSNNWFLGIPEVVKKMDGYQYRCIVSGEVCESVTHTSNPATLTVSTDPNPLKSVVTSNPGNILWFMDGGAEGGDSTNTGNNAMWIDGEVLIHIDGCMKMQGNGQIASTNADSNPGGTIEISGHIVNDNDVSPMFSTADDTKFVLVGSALQKIQGDTAFELTNFNTIFLNKSSSNFLNLEDDISIKQGLVFGTAGNIDLRSKTMKLIYINGTYNQPTIEGEVDMKRIQDVDDLGGEVLAVVAAISSDSSNPNPFLAGLNLGNIGAEITDANNLLPGRTLTLKRGHTANSQGTNTSIERYYTVLLDQPLTNDLGFKFHYLDADRGTITESGLSLFKSETGTNNPWEDQLGTLGDPDMAYPYGNFSEKTDVEDLTGDWTLYPCDGGPEVTIENAAGMAITEVHLCHGDTTTISTSIVNTTPGLVTYQWEIDGVIVGTGSTYPAIGIDGTVNQILVVIATNAYGCQSKKQVTLIHENQLTLDVLSDTEVLCGGGSISLPNQNTNILGSLPYTSVEWNVWNNSDPNNILVTQSATTYNFNTATAGLTLPGVYTVEVTASTDYCSVTDTIEITVNPELVVNMTSSAGTNFCNPINSTTLDPTVSGGSGSYDYAWTPSNPSGGASTFGVINISATTNYSVLITDSIYSDCAITTDITLNYSDIALMSENITHVDCFGNSTGAIDFNITGANSPLTITCVNASAMPTGTITENAGFVSITALPVGNYTVTITDGNGCVFTEDFLINQPSAALALDGDPLNMITHVLCNGSATGQINLTVTGGGASYTYSWTGPDSFSSSDQDIMGLLAGVYTVVVTDGNGCTLSQDFTITEPSSALAFVGNPSDAIVDVACFGDATGSISLTVTGGTVNGGTVMGIDGYQVSWSGPVSNTGTIAMDGGMLDITGLSAGDYSVVVTDDNGCDLAPSLSFTINEPDELLLAANAMDVSCFGADDGLITVQIYGGTTNDYQITWSGPESGTAPVTDSLYQIDLLSGGEYTLMVTDANGCTKDESITLSEPSTLFEIDSVAITHVQCPEDTDTGAITLGLSGGVNDYSIQWENTTAGGAVQGPLTFTPGLNTIPNLTAGNYSVTISDSNSNPCVIVENYLVNAAPAAIEPNETVTQITCNGETDGAISLAVTGGTGGYTYQWIGTPNLGSNDPAGSSLTDLVVGVYSVTVTDANLPNVCTAEASFQITQPAILETQVDTINHPACFDSDLFGPTGSIDLTMTGGTPPYAIEAIQTDGTDTESTTTTLSTVSIYLYSGIWNITITDAYGCVNTITDIEIILPPALGFNPSFVLLDGMGGQTVPITDSTFDCFGDIGQINFGPTGGTPPYTITWTYPDNTEITSPTGTYFITGLTEPGQYYYEMEDANGCTFPDFSMSEPPYSNYITITSPSEINISGVVTDVTINGMMNGAIDITVTGGTPNNIPIPYAYLWSNGETTEDLTNISGGTYTVVVTDENGCTQSETFGVYEPDELTLQVNIQQNPDCIGSENGVLWVEILGGVSPYTVSWSTGITFNTIQYNLDAGDYTLMVTDGNGATVTGTYTLVNPVQIDDGEVIVLPICNGGNDGSITLNPSWAADTTNNIFEYQWEDFSANTTNTINNLTAGDYTVTITYFVSGDEYDTYCEFVETYTIVAPDSILTDNPVVTDVSCFGLSDGSIDLVPTGGIPPFTYSFEESFGGGATGTGNGSVISGLVSSTYDVTITDALGCSDSQYSVYVDQPLPINVFISGNSYICDNESTVFDAGSGAGFSSYLWSANAETTPTITVSDAGIYSVTVTNSDGCTATASQELFVYPSSTISNVVTTCNVDNLTYSIDFAATGINVYSDFGTVTDNMDGTFTILNVPSGQGVNITSEGSFDPPCADMESVTADCSCTTVPDAPVILTSEITICEDETIPTFTATVGTDETVDWYDVPTNGMPVLENSLDYTPTVAGVYYAEARNTIDDCQSTTRTSITLTINPLPTADAGVPVTICAGEATTLDASASTGNTTLNYSWTPVDDLNDANIAMPIATPTTGTLYTLVITDQNACSQTADVMVNLNPLPTLMVNNSSCSPDLLTYTIELSTTGDAVSILPSDGTETVTDNLDGTFTISSIPSGTDVTITSEITATTCQVSLIQMGESCDCPIVAAPINDGDAVICADESIPTLTVTVGADETANWYDMAAGGTLLAGANTSYTPTAAGTFYVEAINTTTNCTSTVLTPVMLTIHDLPIVDAGDDVTICEGESTTLDASASTGNGTLTYSWTPVDDLDNPNIANPVANPTINTTYTIEVTDGNTCISTGQVQVEVNLLPTLTVNSSICSPDLQTYTIELTTNGNSVSILPSNGMETIIDNSDGTFTISGIPSGIDVTVTSEITATTCQISAMETAPNCGCPTIAAPINDGDVVICADEPIPTLTVTVGADETANWYDMAAGGTLLAGASTSYTPTATGTFYVEAINTTTNCLSAILTPVMLTINTLPIADAGMDADICIGESTTLDASASTGNGILTYSWTPVDDLDDPTLFNPVATPSTMTTYTVEISDENSCTSTADVVVNVNPLPTLTVGSPSCAANLQTYSFDITTNGDAVSILPNTGIVTDNLDGTFTISGIPNGNDVTVTTEITGTTCQSFELVTAPDCGCPVINAPTIGSGDLTICADQIIPTLSVTVGAGETADWYDAASGGLLLLLNSTDYTPTTAGTFYAQARNTTTNCLSNDLLPVTLIINALPIADAGMIADICIGESTILDASASTGNGVLTYAWTPTTNLDDPNIVNPVATPTTTTIYTILITDENGCTATEMVTVNVNDLPVADAGMAATICVGESTTLDASGSTGNGILMYSWTPIADLDNSNIVNPVANPITTTIYTVLITDENGCTATETTTINVNDLPVADAGTAASICVGESTTLDASGSTGSGVLTYSWTPVDHLDNPNIANPIANPILSGPYTVLVTDENGCTESGNVAITVNPVPTITLGSPLCDVSLLTYSVSISSNGDLVTASLGNVTDLGSNDYLIDNVPAGQEVVITSEFSGTNCQTMETVTAPDCSCPIVDLPISLGDVAVCEGLPIPSLEVTVNAGETVDWYDAPENGDLLLAGSLTFDASISGIYYAEARNTANNCISDDRTAVTLTIHPPVVADAGSNSSVCIGESTTLDASASMGTGMLNYSWTPVDDLDNPNIPNPVATPTTITVYTVEVSDENGCSSSAEVEINVNLLPTITLNDTICSIDLLTYSIELTTDGDSILLNPIVGIVIDNLDGTFTISEIPSDIDVIVTSENTATTCQNSILVPAPDCSCPTITAPVSDGDAEICSNETPPILTVTVGVDETADWYDAASGGLLLQGSSTSYTPLAGGTFYVQARDTITNCTSFNFTPVALIIDPVPTVQVSDDVAICIGESTTLDASNSASNDGSALNYSWTPVDGLDDPNIAMPLATPIVSTIYSVEVTDGNGCSSTGQVAVSVNTLPTADAGMNTSICLNENTLLDASGSSSSNGTALSYIWTPATGLSSTNSVNPTAMPLITTIYTVGVTDENGCTATSDVEVAVNNLPTFTVNAVDCSTDLSTYTIVLTTDGDAVSITPSNGMETVTDNMDGTFTISEIPADQNVTINIAITATGCELPAAQGGINAPDCDCPTVNPPTGVSQAICFGEGIPALTVTVASGETADWYDAAIDGNLLPNGSGTLNYTPTGAGTFYVEAREVMNMTNCTSTIRTAVSLTINTLPDAVAGLPVAICLGDATQLDASGSNSNGNGNLTYSWSPAIGLSATDIPNPVANPTVTTIYTVEVTDENGCSDTDDIELMVNPLPVVTTDATISICLGESEMLNAIGSGGTGTLSYSWSPAIGLSATNIPNPIANPTVPTTYIVEVTDENGCLSTAETIVSINDLPILNIISAACSPDLLTYTVELMTDGNQITQNLTNPAIVIIDNGGGSFTIEGIPAGEDIVIISTNSLTGCQQSLTLNHPDCSCDFVDAPINNGNQSFCFGTTPPLPTLSVSVNAGETVDWYDSSTGSILLLADNLAYTPTQEGIYYAETRNELTNCISSVRTPVTLTLNPLPIADAGQDVSFCLNAGVALDASGSSGNGILTYTWTPIADLDNPNIANPIANPTEETTFTVAVTDENGCSSIADVTVTPFDLPIANAGNDVQICADGSTILDGTSSTGTGNLTYVWTPIAGLDNPNIVTPTATPTVSTTYTLEISDDNGCTATSTVLVTVNPLPEIDAGDDVFICEGESVSINVINLTGANLTYSWIPDLWLSAGNIANPIATPESSISYLVEVTDENGCVYSDDIAIIVNPTLTVDLGDDVAICEGFSILLDASNSTGVGTLNYAWTPSTSLNADDIATPTANPSVTTTYTVTVSDFNGCTVTDQITVNVNENPIADAGQDVSICVGEALTLDASASTGIGILSYVWSSTTGMVVPNNIPNPVVTPTETTTYTVEITDENGCESTAEIIVTVNELPIANAGNDATICEGENITLDASLSTGQGMLSYLWTSTTDPVVPNDVSNPEVTPIETTTYTLQITDSNGCESSAEVIITVNAAIIADAGNDIAICQGESTTLDASASVGQGSLNYLWTPATGLDAIDTAFPIANPIETTIYTVLVTNGTGCESTAEVEVTVNELPNIEILGITCTLDFNNYEVELITDGNVILASTGTVIGNGGGFFVLTNIPIMEDVTITSLNTTTNCEFTQEVEAPDCICPFLDVPINNGDLTICESTPITALSVTVNIGETADWYDEPMNGTLLLAGSTSFTPTEAGVFYVEARDSANGCTSNERIAVTLIINELPLVSFTDPADVCTNGATITLSGMPANGTFSGFGINGNQFNPMQVNVGTYDLTYTFTDANGCSNTAMQNIEVFDIPVISPVSNSPVCDGGNLVLTEVGGEAMNWTWSTPSGTILNGQNVMVSPFTNLEAGIYQLTISDENTCTNTSMITAELNPPIIVNITPSSVMLCIGSSVEITAAATGGTGDLTYSWVSPSGMTTTGAILTATETGAYIWTVMDAAGCMVTGMQPVSGNSMMTIGLTSIEASCNAMNGSLSATVNGGLPPYDFEWEGFANQTNTLTDIGAGSYLLTVTDDAGCVFTEIGVVSNISGLVITQEAVLDVLCAGEATGSIDLSIAGGTPDYTFNWSNGATTEDISDLENGDYIVEVMDATGCVEILSITISEPQPLAATFDTTPTSTLSATDGAIDLTVTGGTLDYSYLWNTGANSEDLSNIAIGPYSVVITDGNGCTLQEGTTVPTTASLAVNLNGQNISCFGDMNGSIQAVASGSFAPFTFLWNTGSMIDNINNLPVGFYTVTVTDQNDDFVIETIELSATSNMQAQAQVMDIQCNGENNGEATILVVGGEPNYLFDWSTGASASILTDLSQGDYEVTITDDLGCTLTLPVMIEEPAVIAITTESITQIDCFGEMTGAIDITISGGTGTYSQIWSQNSISEDISNLIAGDYTVTITDINQCTATNNLPLTITQSPELTVDFNGVDVLCFGDATGSILATASGGVSSTNGYQYQWIGGETTPLIENLIADNYFITVTDDLGCTVANNDFIEQAPALSNVFDAEDISCFGFENGSILTDVSGGNTPYTYLWSNDSLGSFVENLAASNYSLTITDANSCELIDQIEIIEPDTLLPAYAVTDLNCFGDFGGAINLTISGGTTASGNYSILWNNGQFVPNINQLAAGEYSVILTDDNGCFVEDTIMVNQPDAFAVMETVQDPLCFNDENGTISLAVIGGIAPYDFDWSTGEINTDVLSSQISNLADGSYSSSITDANGCTTIQQSEVTEPDLLGLNFQIQRAGCTTNDDGSVDITVSGGTPAYSFNWNNNEISEDISAITAGNYSVTVLDANNCELTRSFVIAETDTTFTAYFLAASGLFDVDTVEVFADEIIQFIDVSNPLPLTWDWSFNDPSNNSSNLPNPAFGYPDDNTADETAYFPKLVVSNLFCRDSIDKQIWITNNLRIIAPPKDSLFYIDFKEVKAYPNPSTGLVTVEVELTNTQDLSLNIVDAVGMIHQRKEFSDKDTYKIELDMSDLTPGIYFINLHSSTRVHTVRVVIVD